MIDRPKAWRDTSAMATHWNSCASKKSFALERSLSDRDLKNEREREKYKLK